MKLSEYDDEDLIEEIKHRGIKITVDMNSMDINIDGESHTVTTIFKGVKVYIGGVEFELTQ